MVQSDADTKEGWVSFPARLIVSGIGFVERRCDVEEWQQGSCPDFPLVDARGATDQNNIPNPVKRLFP